MAYKMTENRRTSERAMRRKEMEIACKCWFTSKGDMHPLMFKYQDDEGVIHTITEIQVHSRKEIDLIASPCTEFDVSVNCQGIYIKAKLIFYKKDCRWVMVANSS